MTKYYLQLKNVTPAFVFSLYFLQRKHHTPKNGVSHPFWLFGLFVHFCDTKKVQKIKKALRNCKNEE